MKLLKNCLCGEQIRKDIEESFACISEAWMLSEYDERVKDYWKISQGNYIVKTIDDAGLEDEVKELNTMPLHLVAFVLSNSKRIMNNFLQAIIGFYTNDAHYTDTDSLYIENKHWEKLDKAGLVGKYLLQRKNDYKDGGILYGLFLVAKMKNCLTVNKYGVIDEYKTFKGFTNVSDKLDRKEVFRKFNGDKLIAKVPLTWKKFFSQGVVIPHKMRNCGDCKKNILCANCDKLVNQNKEELWPRPQNYENIKRTEILQELKLLQTRTNNSSLYIFNFCVILVDQDMVPDTRRATTCRRQIKARQLQESAKK